jgi:signal transduction histidine kinase
MRTVSAGHEKHGPSISDKTPPPLKGDTADIHLREQMEERLRVERKIADETIEAERNRADAAIANEGDELQVTDEGLLAKERSATDKDLSEERLLTDADAQRSADLLSQERTEHGKARAALTTRDEFLAIVSHDLRTPLNFISMATRLLAQHPCLVTAADETKSLLSAVTRNVAQMVQLIEDLLDVERIANGKLILNYAQNDMGDIIALAVEQLAEAAATKGIKLDFNRAETTALVICDRGRILQVLSNLIGNAVKFTPPGGAISITMKITNTDITVSVTDTGTGMPSDKIHHIFNRFSQINNRDRRGLGLGLYISKMMIQAHGGKISVNSKLGEGSTFRFSVPVRLPS